MVRDPFPFPSASSASPWLSIHWLLKHCHSFPDTHSKTFLLICLRCASVSPPIPSPYLVSSMVGNTPASPQNSSGIIYFETEGPESLRFYANTMQCPCLMSVYLPICIFCLIKFSWKNKLLLFSNHALSLQHQVYCKTVRMATEKCKTNSATRHLDIFDENRGKKPNLNYTFCTGFMI